MSYSTTKDIRALLYDEQRGLNRNLGFMLVRAIGGFVDYFVARDSKEVDKLADKYGLELRVRVQGAIQAVDAIPRVKFSGSVNGAKTALALRGRGLDVPQYVEEIVLSGNLQRALYKGQFREPPGKFQIFDVGNDVNVLGCIPYHARRIQPSLDYILDEWNFVALRESRKITGKIAEAVIINKVKGKYRVSYYDPILLNEAFDLIASDESARFFFENDRRRRNAMRYGKSLGKIALKNLEREMLQCTIPRLKEILEELFNLLASYFDNIDEVGIR